jgi:hypothetical protein
MIRFAGERLMFSDDKQVKVTPTFLAHFGATRLVHGHTQITEVREIPPSSFKSAWIYVDGHCINVDHGIVFWSNGTGH